MTLSTDQIQELFDFTRKKYVHFYDLQSEIVDHLAAAIEDKMDVNKKLSFEQALEEVYKGFGIFGFSHVVREKEKQIDKQSQRMLWKEIILLFSWPHLLFSMLLLISLYTLTQLLPMEFVLLGSAIISLTLLPIYLYKIFKYKKPLKLLRMLNYYQPQFSTIPYLYVQVYINIFEFSGISYILITFFSIIYLIASFKVNAKLKSNAMTLYPEAFTPEISK